MARLARMLGALVLLAGLAVAAFWVFAPRERVPGKVTFDPARLGDDLDAYFRRAESDVPDLRREVRKRVIWAGVPGARTDLSLLYVHGFSATSEELRPVPDRVASELGANLVFTRLAGHGQGGAALAEARLVDWMRDMAEGLAAARAAGDEVVVMATSTGATLATLAAADPALMARVRGLILVSPNFAVNNPRASLLTWPGARWWLPIVAGRSRGFEPLNEDHARYWTTEYPTEAVLPMAALVAHVRAMDHAALEVPALFWFSESDQVVRAEVTREVAQAWGGPVTLHPVRPGPEDDPMAHVLAGDILSPGQTEAAVAGMTGWIRRITGRE
ncbi:MAG: alpha/beta hydrolase [Paracoccaceae bacterium]